MKGIKLEQECAKLAARDRLSLLYVMILIVSISSTILYVLGSESMKQFIITGLPFIVSVSVIMLIVFFTYNYMKMRSVSKKLDDFDATLVEKATDDYKAESNAFTQRIGSPALRDLVE
jgi:hypothetical protein